MDNHINLKKCVNEMKFNLLTIREDLKYTSFSIL